MEERGRSICVIGNRNLQNELLVCHISEKSGFKCGFVDNVGKLSKWDETSSARQRLILYDCLGLDREALLNELQSLSAAGSILYLLGLYNLRADIHVEEEALGFGVHGFFYENDSADCMLKGVEAIFDGEFWIPRKIMTECFLHLKHPLPQHKKKVSVLTDREAEILSYVAAGATNDAIALKLCISPHTVRTHIYNIFKKIHVSNRMKASLWANKNL